VLGRTANSVGPDGSDTSAAGQLVRYIPQDTTTGIGRREFLQLFGGALATLTANASSAIAVLDDQYINRKLGIAFRKPHGWTFADDIESCQSMLKDFSVTSPPRPTRISQSEAAEYYATFVFEHENMQRTPVRMRTLAIYQGPAFYTLRLYDSPDAESDLVLDYTSFVESVKMV